MVVEDGCSRTHPVAHHRSSHVPEVSKTDIGGDPAFRPFLAVPEYRGPGLYPKRPTVRPRANTDARNMSERPWSRYLLQSTRILWPSSSYFVRLYTLYTVLYHTRRWR